MTSEGKPCERFYVPSAYEELSKLFSGEGIWVTGVGDAMIIKSLITKGLAEARNLANYACQITPLGIEVYNDLAENDKDVLTRRKQDEDEQERLRKEWGDEE